MTFWEEAKQSTTAALQLARFDTAGMAGFNNSLDGFWRSFGAAILLAPFSAIIVLDIFTFAS